MTNPELERTNAELELRIAIAQRQRELADILAELAPREDEQERVARLRKSLAQSLAKAIGGMRSVVPENPDPSQFAADWVVENWGSRFRHIRLQNFEFPDEIVQDALAELYRRNHVNRENGGALQELQNGNMGRSILDFLRALRDRRRRRNNPPAKHSPAPDNQAGAGWRHQPGRGKRAGEMRTERRQHAIQRRFSLVSVVFTFVTAMFMTMMLLVGTAQLYNAIAQGFGIPLRVRVHESVADLADSGQQAQEEHAGHGPFFMSSAPANPHEAMTTSLLALEIVLVAPLPYLLLLGLTRYIKALAYQQSANEFRRELLEFKAFEVALFIAIIAAALVERILRDRLDWQFSAAVVPVLAVLAAYYYIIENACNEAESHES